MVCRFGRCGNRRGIELRLGCYGRLRPGVRSCLCRCTPAIGGCRRKCCAAARCRRSRGGYGGRCGRVGRPVGKCRSRNRLRQTAAVRHRRRRRFGRGRLKNRNRVCAYRTHPTSGLKVLCGLRLATLTKRLSINLVALIQFPLKCVFLIVLQAECRFFCKNHFLFFVKIFHIFR